MTDLELEAVRGGCDNGTKLSVGGTSLQTCTSDYALCSQRAGELAAKQYPDTRPNVLGLPLPFTTDDNAAARAKATADTTRSMCGPPSK